MDKNNSITDPMYLNGGFFEKSTGSLDARFKVEQLLQILTLHKEVLPAKNLRIADVGCGSGATTYLLKSMFDQVSGRSTTVEGFDVHPYIKEIDPAEGVRFIAGEFCEVAEGYYDMVALLDVFEHVPNPISFIGQIAQRTNLIAFYVPLDDSFFSWIRGLPRSNLSHPGHLIVLDAASTINLITFSGLRIIDFQYSPGFMAPSGKSTTLQKIMAPFRAGLFYLNPYLAQKLLSGVSLTILAWTAKGLSAISNKGSES